MTRVYRKLTEDEKAYISKRTKEAVKNMSKEKKEQMRKNHLKAINNPETKRKRLESFKKTCSTEEHKIKMSKAMKESHNTEAYKIKSSFSQKRRYENIDERLRQSNKMKEYYKDETNKKFVGQKTKEAMNNKEIRDKLSKNISAAFQTKHAKMNHLIGNAKQQRNRKNKYELLFIKLLENNNIEYNWQVPILTDINNKGFIIDFYLPKYSLYINIDGSAHIYHKKQDELLDTWCIKNNMKLLHINVKDLDNINLKLLLENS